MESTESGAWHKVGAQQTVAITVLAFTVTIVTPASPQMERY